MTGFRANLIPLWWILRAMLIFVALRKVEAFRLGPVAQLDRAPDYGSGG
jgi:hypothetical protein